MLLNKKIFFLSVLLVLITACGQDEMSSSKDTMTIGDENTNSPSVVVPKLHKSQGSDKYGNICCAIEDRNGNLWFGSSAEGVYRFDGQAFTQYTVDDGLNSNCVRCILEARDGNIWFGTSDGICRYDISSSSIIPDKPIVRVPIAVADTSLLRNPNPPRTNEVWSMLQDQSGNIWFGTSTGLFCYDGVRFTHFLRDHKVINTENLQLKMICDILEDNNGEMWFTSGMAPGGEGVVRYDGNYLTSSKPNGDGWVRSMIQDKTGNIWFNGRHNGVFRYDGKMFSMFIDKEHIGSAVLQDNAGNIWFTGEEHDNGYSGVDGVWWYDGKEFKNFGTNDGLGDYGVWCIIEDREGNIWFGTRNTGLYRFDGNSFVCVSE